MRIVGAYVRQIQSIVDLCIRTNEAIDHKGRCKAKRLSLISAKLTADTVSTPLSKMALGPNPGVVLTRQLCALTVQNLHVIVVSVLTMEDIPQ
jgi:hypothetical protein